MKRVLILSLAMCALAACGRGPFASSKSESGNVSSTSIAELLGRWNEAAKGVQGGDPDFRWTDENKFPHPTDRFGTKEAYETCAEVLVRFLSTGDNVEFSKVNGFLTEKFGTELPPEKGGFDITLRGLVFQWSDPIYMPGFFSDTTRQQLRSFCPAIGC